MTDRLTPQREAEIAEQMKQALSDAGAFCGECGFEPGDRGCSDCEWCYRRYVDGLMPILRAAMDAELAAVRAERDEQRERALDALNRSVEDGREVCADCGRPVTDGPCGVHSPDAVFQRAAREAAQLRAERDKARARVAELEALTPAPIQTCRVCGAGYTYGEPCSVCEFKARMARETGGAR